MADREELRAAAEGRVGHTVSGKFRLLRLLGCGGMAAVYAARHRNGNHVALKMLHGSLSSSPQQRKRFAREAYVGNTIGHDGVVHVHDDGVAEDGTAYLVMELLDGDTVGALQRRASEAGASLELEIVFEIAEQLLDVLAAAHARGVVHRDIKPDNLFVTREGRLKVLDFGIARLYEHVPGATIETQAGVMLGTPAFMPQEQARGRWDEVDERSDLWAVGATLFTLVSDELVHVADTPQEQLGRAMSVPARSLAQVAPALPSELIELIDRALRFERSERWPSAKAMQKALRRLRSGSSPEAEPRRALRAAMTTAADSITPLEGVELPRSRPASSLPSRPRARFGFVALAIVLGSIAFAALRPTTWNAPTTATRAARPMAAAGAAPSATAASAAAPVPTTVAPALALPAAPDLPSANAAAQPTAAPQSSAARPASAPAARGVSTGAKPSPKPARVRAQSKVSTSGVAAATSAAVDPMDRRR